ncbi:rhomboid family intramembrane serine protease [Streptomyces mashuensis]|uniref:Rhomboid family intramembrane serine protease n=1 Tax=Streptomyces mashuensis TaxID=33904 RepID=A0A919B2P1_9ACTN|nr:rhomboid family intramembrane serine protease [Streptomyces mashuensis]GHF43439.1 rhomboid family intramembrane serine protease [Streptomyces mashuensis]
MNDQAVCCYRHPDRETGIRCTRCERPICPDCMVSASVGFQCPECAGGGGAGGGTGAGPRATAPRTIAGSVHVADPRLVTKIILAVNAGLWIAVMAGGEGLLSALEMLGRARVVDGGPLEGVAEGQWYRLLSAAFLHQRPEHIALNMISLWWLGPPLEVALGRLRFVVLYVLSALGGSALSYLVAAPNQPSLGASGAIFGLLGATAVLMHRLKYDMRPIIALLVLNLIFTFTWSDIAREAHIGGLVVGAAVAFGMVHAPRGRRALVQWGTAGAALVVIAAMVFVRTQELTGG